MTAAILCGGKGTRLRSVIGEHQKCAVDVGGRPWIHRVLDFLEAGGIERAILLTGYKAEEIESAAAEWLRIGDNGGVGKEGMIVECLRSKPSGPEAAIQLAFAKTKEKALIVVNGDTLVWGFDLKDFSAACEASRRTGRRQSTAVRGRSALNTKDVADLADSGIYFRVAGATRPMTEWLTPLPYLDIGSPKGLAEARRRFG